MRSFFLLLVVALIATHTNAVDPNCICPSNSTGLPSCLGSDPCTNAAQVWQWAVTVCAAPNPSCTELCNIIRNVVKPYTPSLNQVTIFNATYDWGNLYYGAGLSTYANNAATFGEMAYVANNIATAWKTTPATASATFLAWQAEWKALADRLVSNGEVFEANDQLFSARNSYLRATEYYFMGLITGSRSGLGQDLFEGIVNTFPKAIALIDFDCHFYSFPYTQENVTFNISGTICFPQKTGKFNLVVFVGGLDFPFQQIWLMFGQGALNRGYAITFFDGPGHDNAVPYSRFVKNYELPTGAVISHIKAKFENRIKHKKIVIMGGSLGGYLAGEVCAGLGNQIDACIPNPPVYNLPGIANNLLLGPMFQSFQVALATAPELIPSGYASYLADPNDNVFVPLVSNCGDFGKGVVGNILLHAPIVFPPTLFHICERFAPLPHYDSNLTAILEHCGYAYDYLQTFVNTRLAEIVVPVLALAGLNDTLEHGQEQGWFNQLNPTTKAQSELYFFDPQSGGSMHVQVGAQQVLDEKIYAWLDSKGIKGHNY